MKSRTILLRVSTLLCAVSLGVSALGCSASHDGAAGPETGATDDELKTQSADPAFADLIAHTKSLTEASSARLLRAAVEPMLTTTRLKMLNQFGAKQPDDGDQREMFGGNVQVLYGSAPRDVEATPAGFGGQSFKTTIDISGNMVGKVSFKISGTAHADYALAFTMADQRVKIARVPAGSTAKDTAKLIADAIDADKDAIKAHIFDEKGIGPKLGPYGGLDDLECSADEDSVTLLEEING